jgi:hypothetical protein
MKKSLPRFLLTATLILLPVFLSGIFADDPGGPPGPPPNPGGGGGVVVGAPIDDSLLVLIALGAFYGCYKLYVIWRNKTELEGKEPA